MTAQATLFDPSPRPVDPTLPPPRGAPPCPTDDQVESAYERLRSEVEDGEAWVDAGGATLAPEDIRPCGACGWPIFLVVAGGPMWRRVSCQRCEPDRCRRFSKPCVEQLVGWLDMRTSIYRDGPAPVIHR